MIKLNIELSEYKIRILMVVLIYIPMFCGKELCEHGYLRECDAFDYIIKDVNERFLIEFGDFEESDNSSDEALNNTPNVELIDTIEEINDLLEISTLTNNIQLIDKINDIFKLHNQKENYSIKQIKVYPRYSPVHYF